MKMHVRAIMLYSDKQKRVDYRCDRRQALIPLYASGGVSRAQEESPVADSVDRNPFILPPDEEVFRMREEEKSRKAQERVARREQKVRTTLLHLPLVTRKPQLHGVAYAAGPLRCSCSTDGWSVLLFVCHHLRQCSRDVVIVLVSWDIFRTV